MIKLIHAIEALTPDFSGVRARNGIRFKRASGSITAAIRPTATCKTSLLNTICKIFRPIAGSVHFFGVDTSHHRPPARTRLRLVHRFLRISFFLGMTLLDNINFGRYYHLLSKGRDRDDRKITTAMKMRHSSIYKAYSAEIEIIYAGGCAHA
ncbi:MAG: hypothetical protein ABIO64_12965 [Burkholderiaceae bacterium]